MTESDQGLVEAEGAGPAVRERVAAGTGLRGGLRLSLGGPRGPSPPVAPAVGADTDDAELVSRSQSGDRAAFEVLVRRTARLLFSRLYLETGDPHQAEDLVQETYLVAWRSVKQVTEPAGFRTWLLSVAHTVRIDAARREGRKKRAGPRLAGDAAEAIAAVPDGGPSPADEASREEQRQHVLGLLRSMPEEYRQVLTLRYLGGADYETIGRQLGLSNGSLRGLLNRGLAKLREKMKVLSAEC